MARKIQLGALILGMLLIGVERFNAQAAPADVNTPTSFIPPIPPPAN